MTETPSSPAIRRIVGRAMGCVAGSLSLKWVDFTGKAYGNTAAAPTTLCRSRAEMRQACRISAGVTSTSTISEIDPRMLRPFAFSSPASVCSGSRAVPAATVTCGVNETYSVFECGCSTPS